MAVLRDGAVLAEISGDAALTHAERLPGDIDRALDAAGLSLDLVELLAVVAGPGSFTGLRIGIAAIQGLAFARELRVVPVSAFEAIARQTLRTAADEQLVAPWIDAQRGEVFATAYEGSVSRPVVPPSSASPEATLQSWLPVLAGRPILFAGDGAVRYKDAIARTLTGAVVLEPPPRLAAEAARIAADHPERAVAPHGIVPIYIRRPDPELSRGRAPAEGRPC